MLISLEYLIKKYNLNITGVSHFGAHLGQEVDKYIKNNIKNINLYEPQQSVYKKLYEKYSKYEFISFFNFGLGSENSNQILNVEKDNEGQSSSILRPARHLDFYPNINFDHNEKIQIRRYEELDIQNVNLLNIDIQGYELEALKGCGDKLHNVDYIIIEINRDLLYENNPLVQDIDLFLQEYDFIRSESRWASTRLPFGDAFYIKRKHLTKRRIIFSQIKIKLQNIKLYYLFIDPYRKTKKFIYNLKKKIALIIRDN